MFFGGDGPALLEKSHQASTMEMSETGGAVKGIDADGSITTLAARPEGKIDQPANVMVAPGANGDELVYVTNNARFSEQVDGVGPSNDQWFAVPPNEQPVILTSIIKRVDVAAFRLIEHMLSGGPTGLALRLSLADDAYGVLTQGDDFTPAMSEALDDIMTGIAEGRIDVPAR